MVVRADAEATVSAALAAPLRRIGMAEDAIGVLRGGAAGSPVVEWSSRVGQLGADELILVPTGRGATAARPALPASPARRAISPDWRPSSTDI